MLFNSVFTFALVGVTIATPTVNLEKRDAATITQALAAISSKLNDMNTSISNLKAGTSFDETTAKSKAVEQEIKDSTTKIQATTPVSLIEAIGVQSASQKLTDLSKEVVNNLISKKQIIVEAKQQQLVVQQLTAQKQAATGLVQAITSKVPASLQNIAQTLASTILSTLDQGIKAFS